MARWLPVCFEKLHPVEDFEDGTEEWRLDFESVVQIKPLSGRELVNAQQVYENVSHEVMGRYQPEITSDLRINYQGRILHIDAVVNVDEENRFVKLFCTE